MVKSSKCAVALGQFDSVHVGHRAIIAKTVAYARAHGVKSAAFTFDNDVKSVLDGSGGAGASVFSLGERKAIFKTLGIDEVIVAPAEREFLSKTPIEFLDWLSALGDIKAYFCGYDYTFGKSAAGGVDFLREYAAGRSEVFIESEFKDAGGKISTTRIKRLLSVGDIKSANALLGCEYFVTGEVVKERGVGRQMGFPTINLYPDKSKLPLKNAVYTGSCTVGNVKYRAIINYGARPTFGLDVPLVEAHLGGFDGDLYGRTVSVCFDGFLREIRAFGSAAELKEQLKRDVEVIR